MDKESALKLQIYIRLFHIGMLTGHNKYKLPHVLI